MKRTSRRPTIASVSHHHSANGFNQEPRRMKSQRKTLNMNFEYILRISAIVCVRFFCLILINFFILNNKHLMFIANE